MVTMILDENGIHEINDNETIMCPECYTTNEGWRKRCKKCSTKLKQTELTYEQEDYIIESGMEKERELKNVKNRTEK